MQKEGSVFITRKAVRQALKAWPDSKTLGGLPLAALVSVQQQRVEAGHADTASGRGIALRHLVQTAVFTLKPIGDDMPAYDQSPWRIYAILNEQFLQKRAAQQIREELGISESGYFNDQRKGLDALVTLFQEWETALSSQLTVAEETVENGKTAVSPREAPLLTVPKIPVPPTPFIGRETEKARIFNLLAQPEARLITLYGPGGMGKTRLALQIAQEQPNTPTFVQLEAIESAELISPTIAQALGFALDSHEPPLRQLINFLRPKPWLLVLDNFEHLTEAGSEQVSELLRQAPQLKLLITSRERLNIRGEWVVDLQGLDVPQADEADAEAFSAVQLFLDSVRRVRSQASVSGNEMGHVVAICRLVQGMPLGLELAASWSGMISLAEIAVEIEQSLDFLEAGYRDLPTRHQSLRAVFDHSWTLLSTLEQKTFRRLAVFRGSFERQGANVVAGASLPLLLSLSSKSLLRAGENGRFSIHPLLRQFAHEALRQSPAEWQETQAKHGRFYATFIQAHLPRLKQGGQQQRALAVAEEEVENVRAAWQWAIREGEEALLLAIAEAVYHFFTMTNRTAEGSETLGQIADFLRTRPPNSLSTSQRRLLGFATGAQARFLFVMGEDEVARQQFEGALDFLAVDDESANLALIKLLAIPAELATDGRTPEALNDQCLAYFRRVGDKWGVATTNVRYVSYLRNSSNPDDYELQIILMEESLRLREEIGDERGVANALNYLCDFAYERGDYEEARERAEQSLAIHQALGNQVGRAHSLNHLGQVAGSLGDYLAARGYYQESLALLRTFGNPRETADSLDCVGYITYLLEEYEHAQGYYEESLQISREIGDDHGEAWSLHNLGDIARVQGDLALAKRLYTESRDLHQAGDPLSWGGAVSLDKLGRVTLRLGEIEAAERHFLQALRIAAVTERKREQLDALYNLGRLYLLQGEVARARELFSAVYYHPATAKVTLDAVQAALRERPLLAAAEMPELEEMIEEILSGLER